MSEYIFKLPDLGEGTVESEIGEWFIKVGDLVKEEDIVGTVMTDKAAVEVSSPVTGTVVGPVSPQPASAPRRESRRRRREEGIGDRE